MSVLQRFWGRCWLLLALVGPALAQGQGADTSRLVSAEWLQQQLGRTSLRVLDGSPASLHRQGHIPGAVNADLFTFGPREVGQAELQARLRAWGLNDGQPVVIYDQGGSYLAARLFWGLLHQGVPLQQLYILDGGMARWRATGGAVSTEPTPGPAPGTLTLGAVRPEVRVRLPEFLAATADPQRHVMLEALDPPYFYGGAAFFDRAGHVPNATLMPADDFFNADKTYKSPQAIRRMLQHLGVRHDQQVLTYCGGGGAAAVPFFALKFLVGHPDVRLFQESQLGWLQDPRELPVWTYAAPQLLRDTAWLKAWASPMLRGFGLSAVSVLDLRPATEFQLGHVPQALNLPASQLRPHLHDPAALASLLAQAGLNPAHEAVLLSEGGLSEDAALAFMALEAAGQKQVSVYVDNVDIWVERGQQLAKPAAGTAGRPAGAPPPAARPARLLRQLPPPAAAGFERVYLVTGALATAVPADGRRVPLAPAQLLQADGRPKPAKDLWALLEKAGVPRYGELVLVGDEPGPSAVAYLVLRLMGFADVKVWQP
jgi:3-mercaptopyruvate sulfurtransferase SseA